MPLNHEEGEVLTGEGLEKAMYRVVPLEKWKGHQLFEIAAGYAILAFAQSTGSPILDVGGWKAGFQDDQVLVQEYPLHNRLAFIFTTSHAGENLYYPYIWTLPDETVSELINTNKWTMI